MAASWMGISPSVVTAPHMGLTKTELFPPVFARTWGLADHIWQEESGCVT